MNPRDFDKLRSAKVGATIDDVELEDISQSALRERRSRAFDEDEDIGLFTYIQ